MEINELNPKKDKCLICGSDKLHRFKAHASDATDSTLVSIVECGSCSFAWQFPLNHDDQQSINFFESAYADNGKTQSKYFNSDYKLNISKLEYEFVAGLPVDGRTILDIGAGAGIFADVAYENGWAVTAIDPALDPQLAERNPMIRAIKGTTDKIPDGELYDVVTLWDVIEHAATPIELIHKSKQHLKDGGWIVIETGNYKSTDRIIGGTNHWIYQIDHRWYFSPESIKHLLENAGFSEFIVSEKALRPGWNGTTGYAGPSRAQLLNKIIRNPLRLTSHLSKYNNLTKAKDWETPGIGIFAIAARKPDKKN